MTWTSEGIYRDGAIELLKTPEGMRDGRVLVTMTPAEPSSQPVCRLRRGKYHGARMSTEADFKFAQWRGEKEFDGD